MRELIWPVFFLFKLPYRLLLMVWFLRHLCVSCLELGLGSSMVLKRGYCLLTWSYIDTYKGCNIYISRCAYFTNS
ncbi:hypothetical protein MIMGU_mgv1a017453mg [Erythranthe guttata]|uniref:Uncharacterized protein n=1 Tax=Erythranthe guttata TaxID=4155 RepID=A0A022RGC6_ERYGU|nr:hypothetical protein MIMGU_mgv1a017453mg [Erythranthe guttata]